MRVLVCGGRTYSKRLMVFKVLDTSYVTVLAQGGARGADALAREWALVRGVPFRQFDAEWRRYGNSAGPRRNSRMLAEFKPELCIAFAGGYGTADMVRKCRAAGIEVEEFA